MPGWLSIRAVQKLSRTLARAEERDFERKALPCLRLRWPTMQQAPSTASWDRKGIDLFTWEEQGPFTCVVQCKGFSPTATFIFDLRATPQYASPAYPI